MTQFWESAPSKKNNNSKVKYKTSFTLPNPSFKKESIKSKKLSKYGDADLDGTPNIFDCDPRNVAADGWFSRHISKIAKSIVKKYIAPKPKPAPKMTKRITYTPAKKITQTYGSRPTTTYSGGGQPSRTVSSGGGGGGLSSGPTYVSKDIGLVTYGGVKMTEAQRVATVAAENVAAKKVADKLAQDKRDRRDARDARKRREALRQSELFKQSELLRQREQAAKSAAIQKATKPKLTAAQEAQMRKMGIVGVSQILSQQRMAKHKRFKSLKQRAFEKKYPGYYYNEDFF